MPEPFVPRPRGSQALGTRLRIAMTVDIYLDCNVPISEIADFKSTYFGLKAFARKLDIKLPRQIPEETTAEHEKRRFYQNQINYVKACTRDKVSTALTCLNTAKMLNYILAILC